MVFAFFLFSWIEEYLGNAFTGSWIFSSVISAYGIMFSGRLIGCVYRERLSMVELEPDYDTA